MRIVIGEGSCGIAAGAQKVRSALEALYTEEIGSTEAHVHRGYRLRILSYRFGF